MAKRVSREEFEHLCRMIQRWNENRLELFEITMPSYEVSVYLDMIINANVLSCVHFYFIYGRSI